jgi:phage major head subunit gpT-like protein
MSEFTDNEGRPLGLVPNLLVVNPANRDAALTVISADKIGGGNTNINKDAVDVLMTPYLIDPTP